MSGAVIHIADAVVAHREGTALRGASLEVARGEAVGIIGPNGAGKTTLLTLVNGLGRLHSGTVRVLGENPFHWRRGHLLRRRVGHVAQVQRLDPRLPILVEESVAAGRYGRLGFLRRMGPADRRAVRGALEAAGIAHLARRPLGHLSGGECQRAAIARVLAQEPEIFLFDEPTASVDPGARGEILAFIEELPARTGATVVYVTHDLAALPGVCNRLALMRGGRVWRCGAREAMLRPGVLNELYEGHESPRVPGTAPAAEGGGS